MKSFTKYFGLYVVAVLIGVALVLLSPPAAEALPCGGVFCMNPDVICRALIQCCPEDVTCLPLIKMFMQSGEIGTCSVCYVSTACVAGCPPF